MINVCSKLKIRHLVQLKKNSTNYWITFDVEHVLASCVSFKCKVQQHFFLKLLQNTWQYFNPFQQNNWFASRKTKLPRGNTTVKAKNLAKPYKENHPKGLVRLGWNRSIKANSIGPSPYCFSQVTKNRKRSKKGNFLNFARLYFLWNKGS